MINNPFKIKRFLLIFYVIFIWSNSAMASLTSDLSNQTFQTGDFNIEWMNEPSPYLQIRHVSDDNKIVWSSIAGDHFISAALAHIEVHEHRGSFEVNEDIQVRLDQQTVQLITKTNDTIIISGTLSDQTNAYHANVILEFFQPLPGHLHFNIRVDNQECNGENNQCDPIHIVYFHYSSDASEQFFGFGEQFSHMNLKGYEVPIISQEGGLGRGRQPITGLINLFAEGAGGNDFTTYTAIPHYITTKFRSLFLETTEYSSFDLTADDKVTIKLHHHMMKGRILFGNTYLDLIERYTEYSGRMIPLPEWLNKGGAIVGMEGGTEEVRKKWDELRAHDTPIAAFWVQDWVGKRDVGFGEQLWWNWVLNSDRYPLWNELINDLKQANIHMMGYINPFLVDPNDSDYQAPRNLYQEALDNGYYIKQSDGSPYFITVTTFPSLLIDLSNPNARIWIKGVMKDEMIAKGFYGWMHDFAEALPFDAVLSSGEPASSYHNQYMVEWVNLAREAVQEAGLEGQIVFFNRAGYTRSPAYATLFWEGDQMVTWDEHDGFKSAIKGLISAGLSGISLNHSDIGGYTSIGYDLEGILGPVGLDKLISWVGFYRREKSLLLRWMEANAFTAVYRTHEGLGPKQNAQFYSDNETYAQFSRFAKVYKALADYRTTLMNEAYEKGYPLVRHLMLHYPNDPEVIDIQYQWMLGSDFLVAPVTNKYDAHVRLYLPQGRWVHIWSNEIFGNETSGEWIDIDAPIGKPAVFYQIGSTAGPAFQSNLRSLGVFNGSISGQISTSILGNTCPIADATIKIVQTGQIATSDSDGYFQLPHIPVGTYDLSIFKTNFAPLIIKDVVVLAEQNNAIPDANLILDDCQCSASGDVNNDDQIGLEELIYTLQQLSAKTINRNVFSQNAQTDEFSSMLTISIDDNQTTFQKTIENVEVNVPIRIVFTQNLLTTSLTNETIVMSHADDQQVTTRLDIEGNIVVITPQVMMTPETTYTISINNLKHINGETLLSGTIQLTTKDLDYGLYWFGKNGLCEKYTPGVPNQFYRPEKPTMIYTHGWKQEAVQRNYERETFLFEEPDENISVYTNHSWLDKGWNTGILYWNQWCEEDEIKDAEAKIWSFKGPKGNRYKCSDGTYKNFDEKISIMGNEISVHSVTDVLCQYVLHSLQDNTSTNIRLVSHSLGNQLMTSIARQLKTCDIDVKRLTYLEPLWTEGEKDYLGDENHDGQIDHVSHRCYWYVIDLLNNRPNDFAFEIYNSSASDTGILGDSNSNLRRFASEISVRPWYYNTQDIEKKHNVIRYHYLWSFAFAPPVECTINFKQRIKTGNDAFSASTADQRIHEMMGSGHMWDQVEGRKTVSPEDDWFEIKDADAPVLTPGNIQGSVHTVLTGNSEQLSNAKIRLLQTEQSVLTDVNGNFSFESIPFGIYSLLIEKDRYSSITMPLVTVVESDLVLQPIIMPYLSCECKQMPGDVTMDEKITLDDSLKIINLLIK
jgi:alpha-glucosidase